MIVIGVDAGSLKAGAAVVEHGSVPHLLTAEIIRMDLQPWASRPPSHRLHFLFTRIAELVAEWRPDVVAVEHSRIRVGGKTHRNLDSYLISAKAQQAAVLGALHTGTYGVRLMEIMASQVRAKLCIRAKKSDPAKEEVRRLFNRRCESDLILAGFSAGPWPVGPVPVKWNDVTDAVALAWTAPRFLGSRAETVHA